MSDQNIYGQPIGQPSQVPAQSTHVPAQPAHVPVGPTQTSVQATQATGQPVQASARPAQTPVQPVPTAAQPKQVPVQSAQAAQATWTPTSGQTAPRSGAYANAASYYPQNAEPKKTRWWIPLIIIAALLLMVGLMFSSCMASLGSLSQYGYGNDFDDNTVAVINLDGTISYDGTANSPEGLKSLLETAADDDNVKAIVLRVNSGGGVAAAGEEMSTYLSQFDKPVVVSSAAINASAAYMISAQSDYIYVLNSTDIGSIGTIMQHYDLSELLAKLGVNIENIKSADSKDSSYYNRPLTEEERAEYQHQVDIINNNFIRMVAEGRNMTEDQVRALADGSTKVGQESVDAGLADAVGTFDDACKKAAELAGLGDDYNVANLTLYSADFSSLVGLLSTGDTSESMKLLQAIREIENNDRVIH